MILVNMLQILEILKTMNNFKQINFLKIGQSGLHTGNSIQHTRARKNEIRSRKKLLLFTHECLLKPKIPTNNYYVYVNLGRLHNFKSINKNQMKFYASATAFKTLAKGRIS